MKLSHVALALLITGSAVTGSEPDDSRHRQQDFILHLNGPVSEVAPLFGPVREADWAPGWNPQFVHPRAPTQAEGAVFITDGQGGRDRIWMVTVYDEKEGRIEYVVITPGVTVNQIKIRISPEGTDRSRAAVTYRHTALSPEGRTEVEKLDGAWSEQQRSHWEAAINAALARGPMK